MPGQDKTGPLGQGPMTGRGFGPCGRGFSRCFRRGFGLRWPQPVQFSETEEKKILQEELKEIETERKQIEERLKELK